MSTYGWKMSVRWNGGKGTAEGEFDAPDGLTREEARRQVFAFVCDRECIDPRTTTVVAFEIRKDRRL